MINVDDTGLAPSGLDLDFEQAQTLAVKWAIRQRLMAATMYVRQGDGTNAVQYLTPRTALAADAHAGDTTLTVLNDPQNPLTEDGPQAVLPNGYLTLADLTDEREVQVADDAAWDGANPVIPLSFRGQDHQGLVFDHPQGTIVTSNLFDFNPVNLDNIVRANFPVLFMTVMRAAHYLSGAVNVPFRQAARVYTLRLEYRMAETQALPLVGTDLMDAVLFSARCQRRCEIAMDVIGRQLRSNFTLMTPLGAIAIGQMDMSNPGTSNWDVQYSGMIVKADVFHYGAVGMLPISANLAFIDT